MADFAAHPGARRVWCLRRRATDVQCLTLGRTPVEVRVMHGNDLVITEMFEEEWMALDWARLYADRLRTQGWFDVPDVAPSAKAG